MPNIRAIIDVHGEAGAQRCWREMMVEHTNTPLLRGVVRTSQALFGASPGSVAKMAPKAWGHVYRDVCELLDMKIGSIGPTKKRCLDKLRRTPPMRGLVEA